MNDEKHAKKGEQNRSTDSQFLNELFIAEAIRESNTKTGMCTAFSVDHSTIKSAGSVVEGGSGCESASEVNEDGCDGPACGKRICVYRYLHSSMPTQTESYEYREMLNKAMRRGRFCGLYSDYAGSRSGFDALIRDCEAHKIDVIVTDTYAHFSRHNLMESLAKIRKLQSLDPPVNVEFTRLGISMSSPIFEERKKPL